MPLRSMLFVPADSERKLAKALASPADVLILDLEGLTWGAEDLSTAVGALSKRDEDGSCSPLYQLASSWCLCAAAAAGVPPIDKPHLTQARRTLGLA